MESGSAYDAWSMGQSYEQYMGRWSRKIAAEFLTWLAPPEDADWLEIGCGTGALTEAILSDAGPGSVLATDASADFVAHASGAIDDARATFKTADALTLPVGDASVDVVTSALVVNFIPDRLAALAEMRRVLRPGGLLSFYVWDYPGGGMGFIDAFWKAAATSDPAASELDEGRRFPFCSKDGLRDLCHEAGLQADIAAIEVETGFSDFEAFWRPFTMGAGPAPGYCASLTGQMRDTLRSVLQERLGADGPVSLTARAWAVRAQV